MTHANNLAQRIDAATRRINKYAGRAESWAARGNWFRAEECVQDAADCAEHLAAELRAFHARIENQAENG